MTVHTTLYLNESVYLTCITKKLQAENRLNNHMILFKTQAEVMSLNLISII